MKRLLLLVLMMAGLAGAALPTTALPAVAATKPQTVHFPVNFRGTISGKIIYFKYFAGMEPDFDILSRVVMEGQIRSKQAPPMTLILDSYIENFQPETQPVLPDLIHPNRSLSFQLGGFFSGEAIIVGSNNHPLYTGALYIEALISRGCLAHAPSCKGSAEPNHMLLHGLSGSGPAAKGSMELRSYFLLNHKGNITGSVYGSLVLPSAARTVLAHGTGHLTRKQILKDFHVAKPAQKGLNSTGGPGSGYCLHIQGAKHCTGNGQVGTCPHVKGATCTPSSTNTGSGNTSGTVSTRPAWMEPLGISLIVLAFLLLIVFFVQQRRPGGQPRPAVAGVGQSLSGPGRQSSVDASGEVEKVELVSPGDGGT